MALRPDFTTAWTSFLRVYGDGSLEHVANFLGGKVKTNIDAGFFKNACALRMSHVLNDSGIRVPRLGGKTVSGDDGKQYLFRVKDLLEFIEQHLDAPDETVANPSESNFAHKRGLLVFEVTVWSDATGHATLWDGSQCADHCYFPKSKRAFFWSFK